MSPATVLQLEVTASSTRVFQAASRNCFMQAFDFFV